MGTFKRKYVYPIIIPIEYKLWKLRRKVDKLYKKIWVYVYVLILLPFIVAGTCQVVKDYKLLSNRANLDALTSPQATSWRTDGNPGQDPPKK